MVREIPLANGGVALIDDEDYERVMPYRWNTWHRRGVVRSVGSTIPDKDGIARRTLLHHFIVGRVAPDEYDHVDRDVTNNQRANLRRCTRAENLRNRGKFKNNKVGFKGVTRQRDKYAAHICCNRHILYIGTFATPVEAAHAYDAKARELHGAFACTNFSEDAAVPPNWELLRLRRS